MRAIVCKGVGQALQVMEVPEPIPQPGEVLVRLKAAGLNHRDLWIRKGQYANVKYPIILGSDGAGYIEKTGDGVKNLSLEQEVIINPGLNWGDHQHVFGKDFKILGLPDNGCLAQYVTVHDSAIFPKPLHLSFEQAAAIPLGGLTGYRALFSRGRLKPGEKLLLTGIGGGVALLMLKFANAIGAEVYVTSGSEDKIRQALNLGAKGGANYKKEDWENELKEESGGFDIIVDSTAGAGFAKLIDVIKPGGRIVNFGGTAGPVPQVIMQRVYWKQIDILGTMMGSPQDFSDMLKLVIEHKIVPVMDEVMPLEQAEKALHKMDDAAQFGKIVLKI
jgi:zinc-binding alcohol dehydrogenase/oxidoreductase